MMWRLYDMCVTQFCVRSFTFSVGLCPVLKLMGRRVCTGNRLTPDEHSALAEALRGNSSVTELDLSCAQNSSLLAVI
eukprot:6180152-Pleurochrysis_carterae.AAC.1